jgi:hypothetical protein
MQSPASYDITIYQGATFELELEYADENNTPVNMSGYTVSGQLWNRLGTSRLASFTTQWTVQASGMFKLTLPASTTSGITEQGRYDILVTEPSGDKFYLLEGSALWNPGLSYKP